MIDPITAAVNTLLFLAVPTGIIIAGLAAYFATCERKRVRK
jgi:hypothetical protein